MFVEDLAVLPLEGVLLFADGVEEDMDGVALRANVIGFGLFFDRQFLLTNMYTIFQW